MEKDPDKAVALFQSGADLGEPYSMGFLGDCYEKGIGVEQNLAEARAWYEKARDHGNPDAAADLGRILLESPNPDDPAHGLELLKESADLESVKGLVYYGIYLWNGHPEVGEDRERARRLFDRAIALDPRFAKDALQANDIPLPPEGS